MPRRPAAEPHPIGKRIKEIREVLGRPRRPWSQLELAGALGMDERTLRRREQDGQLTPEQIEDLAKIAGADVNWVTTGKGLPPSSRVVQPRPVVRALAPVDQSGGARHGGRGESGGVTGVGSKSGALTDLGAERGRLIGLVRDALLGAVDRALARDHELEQTRRGYRILGDAFLDLGLRLADNEVDSHELLRVARELQKLGGT